VNRGVVVDLGQLPVIIGQGVVVRYGSFALFDGKSGVRIFQARVLRVVGNWGGDGDPYGPGSTNGASKTL
jgi:hypothetical protein